MAVVYGAEELGEGGVHVLGGEIVPTAGPRPVEPEEDLLPVRLEGPVLEGGEEAQLVLLGEVGEGVRQGKGQLYRAGRPLWDGFQKGCYLLSSVGGPPYRGAVRGGIANLMGAQELLPQGGGSR